MLSPDHCGLLPIKDIFDVDIMHDFYKCCKLFLEKLGVDYENYFDCLCDLDGLTKVVGVDIPCCNNECGRKYQKH